MYGSSQLAITYVVCGIYQGLLQIDTLKKILCLQIWDFHKNEIHTLPTCTFTYAILGIVAGEYETIRK